MTVLRKIENSQIDIGIFFNPEPLPPPIRDFSPILFLYFSFGVSPYSDEEILIEGLSYFLLNVSFHLFQIICSHHGYERLLKF